MKEYYSKCDEQVTNMLEVDRKREHWKEHPLYRDNTKEDLQKLCHSLRIPTAASVTKLQLAELICRHRGNSLPNSVQRQPYSGRIGSVPRTVKAINQLPASTLRGILHYHKFPVLGSKEQLVLRVFLITQGETAAVLAREEEQLMDLIRISKLLITAQRKVLSFFPSSITYTKI